MDTMGQYYDALFDDFYSLPNIIRRKNTNQINSTIPAVFWADPLWLNLSKKEQEEHLLNLTKLKPLCQTLTERYHKRLVIDGYLNSNNSLNLSSYKWA